MSWFRKTLNEEFDYIIANLEYGRLTINQNWELKRKLKSLYDIEKTDLLVVRKMAYIHQAVRDNPEIYSKILKLAEQLKKELETLIMLVSTSQNIPQEKTELAKNMIAELEILIRGEQDQIKLFREITLAQAIKLGIKVEIFYTVVGKADLQRLLTGQGMWPNDWDRANLGIGLYAFDSIDIVKQYKEIREKTLHEKGINEKLSLVRIVFSEASIREMKKSGKEMNIRLLDPEEYEDWMEKNSSYGRQNVAGGKIKRQFLHRFFHVISLRAQGLEHYFRPECLEEAAIEVIN